MVMEGVVNLALFWACIALLGGMAGIAFLFGLRG